MTQSNRAEFRKKLLHLMIPISLQQLMMALVNASDAFMLGFVSQDALSAVSLAGQIQFVYSLFLFAITAVNFNIHRITSVIIFRKYSINCGAHNRRTDGKCGYSF